MRINGKRVAGRQVVEEQNSKIWYVNHDYLGPQSPLYILRCLRSSEYNTSARRLIVEDTGELPKPP